MLTFLFWNLGGERKKDRPKQQTAEKARAARIKGIVENLSRVNDIDVLMVTEFPIESEESLSELNKNSRTDKALPFQPPDPNSLCDDILIFTRFSSRFLLRRQESSRYTCRLLRLPARQEMILFVVLLEHVRSSTDPSRSIAVLQQQKSPYTYCRWIAIAVNRRGSPKP